MQFYISHSKQIKRNFHNCIEMKYNLDVIKCYVMLCMLCYVMLCYVTLCYVMLCYVMLCYVMLCYVMLCYVRKSSLTDIQALDLL